MTAGRTRAMLALLVFAGWVLITIFSGVFTHAPSEPQPLNVPISQSVQVNLLAAVIFLAVAIGALRWWDIGLRLPSSLHSLRVLWFPALY